MNNILIIQDSPSINAILKFRLESSGFKVQVAETGEEGLEAVKGGKFQLILLDYTLPGINGEEVCKILKKEENTRHIPVLFMSALNNDKLAKLVETSGAEGFISQPFEGKEFIGKIQNFMAK